MAISINFSQIDPASNYLDVLKSFLRPSSNHHSPPANHAKSFRALLDDLKRTSSLAAASDVLQSSWERIISSMKVEGFKYYHSFEELDISQCSGVPCDLFSEFIAPTSNLSPAVAPLHRSSASSSYSSSSSSDSPTLSKAIISFDPSSSPFSSPSSSSPVCVQTSLLRDWSKLKVIGIGKSINNLNAKDVSFFLASLLLQRGGGTAYTLKVLDLNHCTVLTSDSLLLIASGGAVTRSLEVLKLRGCVQVTDAALIQIISHYTHSLRHLDLHGCIFVGPTSITHLAKSSSSSTLTALDCGGCVRLTDDSLVIDTIIYLLPFLNMTWNYKFIRMYVYLCMIRYYYHLHVRS